MKKWLALSVTDSTRTVIQSQAVKKWLALSVTDSTRTVIQSQAVEKWQIRLLEARHLHFSNRLYADSHPEPGSEEVTEQAAGGTALALSLTDSTVRGQSSRARQ